MSQNFSHASTPSGFLPKSSFKSFGMISTPSGINKSHSLPNLDENCDGTPNSTKNPELLDENSKPHHSISILPPMTPQLSNTPKSPFKPNLRVDTTQPSQPSQPSQPPQHPQTNSITSTTAATMPSSLSAIPTLSPLPLSKPPAPLHSSQPSQPNPTLHTTPQVNPTPPVMPFSPGFTNNKEQSVIQSNLLQNIFSQIRSTCDPFKNIANFHFPSPNQYAPRSMYSYGYDDPRVLIPNQIPFNYADRTFQFTALNSIFFFLQMGVMNGTVAHRHMYQFFSENWNEGFKPRVVHVMGKNGENFFKGIDECRQLQHYLWMEKNKIRKDERKMVINNALRPLLLQIESPYSQLTPEQLGGEVDYLNSEELIEIESNNNNNNNNNNNTQNATAPQNTQSMTKPYPRDESSFDQLYSTQLHDYLNNYPDKSIQTPHHFFFHSKNALFNFFQRYFDQIHFAEKACGEELLLSLLPSIASNAPFDILNHLFKTTQIPSLESNSSNELITPLDVFFSSFFELSKPFPIFSQKDKESGALEQYGYNINNNNHNNHNNNNINHNLQNNDENDGDNNDSFDCYHPLSYPTTVTTIAQKIVPDWLTMGVDLGHFNLEELTRMDKKIILKTHYLNNYILGSELIHFIRSFSFYYQLHAAHIFTQYLNDRLSLPSSQQQTLMPTKSNLPFESPHQTYLTSLSQYYHSIHTHSYFLTQEHSFFHIIRLNAFMGQQEHTFRHANLVPNVLSKLHKLHDLGSRRALLPPYLTQLFGNNIALSRRAGGNSRGDPVGDINSFYSNPLLAVHQYVATSFETTSAMPKQLHDIYQFDIDNCQDDEEREYKTEKLQHLISTQHTLFSGPISLSTCQINSTNTDSRFLITDGAYTGCLSQLWEMCADAIEKKNSSRFGLSDFTLFSDNITTTAQSLILSNNTYLVRELSQLLVGIYSAFRHRGLGKGDNGPFDNIKLDKNLQIFSSICDKIRHIVIFSYLLYQNSDIFHDRFHQDMELLGDFYKNDSHFNRLLYTSLSVEDELQYTYNTVNNYLDRKQKNDGKEIVVHLDESVATEEEKFQFFIKIRENVENFAGKSILNDFLTESIKNRAEISTILHCLLLDFQSFDGSVSNEIDNIYNMEADKITKKNQQNRSNNSHETHEPDLNNDNNDNNDNNHMSIDDRLAMFGMGNTINSSFSSQPPITSLFGTKDWYNGLNLFSFSNINNSKQFCPYFDNLKKLKLELFQIDLNHDYLPQMTPISSILNTWDESQHDQLLQTAEQEEIDYPMGNYGPICSIFDQISQNPTNNHPWVPSGAETASDLINNVKLLPLTGGKSSAKALSMFGVNSELVADFFQNVLQMEKNNEIGQQNDHNSVIPSQSYPITTPSDYPRQLRITILSTIATALSVSFPRAIYIIYSCKLYDMCMTFAKTPVNLMTCFPFINSVLDTLYEFLPAAIDVVNNPNNPNNPQDQNDKTSLVTSQLLSLLAYQSDNHSIRPSKYTLSSSIHRQRDLFFEKALKMPLSFNISQGEDLPKTSPHYQILQFKEEYLRIYRTTGVLDASSSISTSLGPLLTFFSNFSTQRLPPHILSALNRHISLLTLIIQSCEDIIDSISPIQDWISQSARGKCAPIDHPPTNFAFLRPPAHIFGSHSNELISLGSQPVNECDNDEESSVKSEGSVISTFSETSSVGFGFNFVHFHNFADNKIKNNEQNQTTNNGINNIMLPQPNHAIIDTFTDSDSDSDDDDDYDILSLSKSLSSHFGDSGQQQSNPSSKMFPSGHITKPSPKNADKKLTQNSHHNNSPNIHTPTLPSQETPPIPHISTQDIIRHSSKPTGDQLLAELSTDPNKFQISIPANQFSLAPKTPPTSQLVPKTPSHHPNSPRRQTGLSDSLNRSDLFSGIEQEFLSDKNNNNQTSMIKIPQFTPTRLPHSRNPSTSLANSSLRTYSTSSVAYSSKTTLPTKDSTLNLSSIRPFATTTPIRPQTPSRTVSSQPHNLNLSGVNKALTLNSSINSATNNSNLISRRHQLRINEAQRHIHLALTSQDAKNTLKEIATGPFAPPLEYTLGLAYNLITTSINNICFETNTKKLKSQYVLQGALDMAAQLNKLALNGTDQENHQQIAKLHQGDRIMTPDESKYALSRWDSVYTGKSMLGPLYYSVVTGKNTVSDKNLITSVKRLQDGFSTPYTMYNIRRSLHVDNRGPTQRAFDAQIDEEISKDKIQTSLIALRNILCQENATILDILQEIFIIEQVLGDDLFNLWIPAAVAKNTAQLNVQSSPKNGPLLTPTKANMSKPVSPISFVGRSTKKFEFGQNKNNDNVKDKYKNFVETPDGVLGKKSISALISQSKSDLKRKTTADNCAVNQFSNLLPSQQLLTGNKQRRTSIGQNSSLNFDNFNDNDDDDDDGPDSLYQNNNDNGGNNNDKKYPNLSDALNTTASSLNLLFSSPSKKIPSSILQTPQKSAAKTPPRPKKTPMPPSCLKSSGSKKTKNIQNTSPSKRLMWKDDIESIQFSPNDKPQGNYDINPYGTPTGQKHLSKTRKIEIFPMKLLSPQSLLLQQQELIKMEEEQRRADIQRELDEDEKGASHDNCGLSHLILDSGNNHENDDHDDNNDNDDDHNREIEPFDIDFLDENPKMVIDEDRFCPNVGKNIEAQNDKSNTSSISYLPDLSPLPSPQNLSSILKSNLYPTITSNNAITTNGDISQQFSKGNSEKSEKSEKQPRCSSTFTFDLDLGPRDSFSSEFSSIPTLSAVMLHGYELNQFTPSSGPDNHETSPQSGFDRGHFFTTQETNPQNNGFNPNDGFNPENKDDGNGTKFGQISPRYSLSPSLAQRNIDTNTINPSPMTVHLSHTPTNSTISATPTTGPRITISSSPVLIPISITPAASTPRVGLSPSYTVARFRSGQSPLRTNPDKIIPKDDHNNEATTTLDLLDNTYDISKSSDNSNRDVFYVKSPQCLEISIPTQTSPSTTPIPPPLGSPRITQNNGDDIIGTTMTPNFGSKIHPQSSQPITPSQSTTCTIPFHTNPQEQHQLQYRDSLTRNGNDDDKFDYNDADCFKLTPLMEEISTVSSSLSSRKSNESNLSFKIDSTLIKIGNNSDRVRRLIETEKNILGTDLSSQFARNTPTSMKKCSKFMLFIPKDTKMQTTLQRNVSTLSPNANHSGSLDNFDQNNFNSQIDQIGGKELQQDDHKDDHKDDQNSHNSPSSISPLDIPNTELPSKPSPTTTLSSLGPLSCFGLEVFSELTNSPLANYNNLPTTRVSDETKMNQLNQYRAMYQARQLGAEQNRFESVFEDPKKQQIDDKKIAQNNDSNNNHTNESNHELNNGQLVNNNNNKQSLNTILEAATIPSQKSNFNLNLNCNEIIPYGNGGVGCTTYNSSRLNNAQNEPSFENNATFSLTAFTFDISTSQCNPATNNNFQHVYNHLPGNGNTLLANTQFPPQNKPPQQSILHNNHFSSNNNLIKPLPSLDLDFKPSNKQKQPLITTSNANCQRGVVFGGPSRIELDIDLDGTSWTLNTTCNTFLGGQYNYMMNFSRDTNASNQGWGQDGDENGNKNYVHDNQFVYNADKLNYTNVCLDSTDPDLAVLKAFVKTGTQHGHQNVPQILPQSNPEIKTIPNPHFPLGKNPFLFENPTQNRPNPSNCLESGEKVSLLFAHFHQTNPQPVHFIASSPALRTIQSAESVSPVIEGFDGNFAPLLRETMSIEKPLLTQQATMKLLDAEIVYKQRYEANQESHLSEFSRPTSPLDLNTPQHPQQIESMMTLKENLDILNCNQYEPENKNIHLLQNNPQQIGQRLAQTRQRTNSITTVVDPHTFLIQQRYLSANGEICEELFDQALLLAADRETIQNTDSSTPVSPIMTSSSVQEYNYNVHMSPGPHQRGQSPSLLLVSPTMKQLQNLQKHTPQSHLPQTPLVTTTPYLTPHLASPGIFKSTKSASEKLKSLNNAFLLSPSLKPNRQQHHVNHSGDTFADNQFISPYIQSPMAKLVSRAAQDGEIVAPTPVIQLITQNIHNNTFYEQTPSQLSSLKSPPVRNVAPLEQIINPDDTTFDLDFEEKLQIDPKFSQTHQNGSMLVQIGKFILSGAVIGVGAMFLLGHVADIDDVINMNEGDADNGQFLQHKIVNINIQNNYFGQHVEPIIPSSTSHKFNHVEDLSENFVHHNHHRIPNFEDSEMVQIEIIPSDTNSTAHNNSHIDVGFGEAVDIKHQNHADEHNPEDLAQENYPVDNVEQIQPNVQNVQNVHTIEQKGEQDESDAIRVQSIQEDNVVNEVEESISVREYDPIEVANEVQNDMYEPTQGEHSEPHVVLENQIPIRIELISSDQETNPIQSIEDGNTNQVDGLSPRFDNIPPSELNIEDKFIPNDEQVESIPQNFAPIGSIPNDEIPQTVNNSPILLPPTPFSTIPPTKPPTNPSSPSWTIGLIAFITALIGSILSTFGFFSSTQAQQRGTAVTGKLTSSHTSSQCEFQTSPIVKKTTKKISTRGENSIARLNDPFLTDNESDNIVSGLNNNTTTTPLPGKYIPLKRPQQTTLPLPSALPTNDNAPSQRIRRNNRTTAVGGSNTPIKNVQRNEESLIEPEMTLSTPRRSGSRTRKQLIDDNQDDDFGNNFRRVTRSSPRQRTA